MKRKSIIILILTSVSFMVYSQNYPIPAQDSQWGEITFFGPPGLHGAGSYGSIYRYDGKDTIINKQNYQYWQGSYTRYNDNKLFMIDPFNSKPDSIKELVLYDFNLAVNDSFLLPLSYHSLYALVSEVSDFTALNGQIRKVITLKINDFPCSNRLKWIEGIGDIYLGIFYFNQLGLCDINNRIVCFSDSSGSVYKESNLNYSCDSLDFYVQLIDGIEDHVISDSEIKITPNPVVDKLILKTDSAFEKIKVFNRNGQVLIESTNNEIDCSYLNSGLYLLEISKCNNTSEVLKFVKK